MRALVVPWTAVLGACNASLVLVSRAVLAPDPEYFHERSKMTVMAVLHVPSFKIYFMLLPGRAQSALTDAIVRSTSAAFSSSIAESLTCLPPS